MKNPLLPAEAVSVLDEQAQATYLERFGVRYVGVQANPGIASRKERRARGDRGHNFGYGALAIPKGRR